MLRTVTREFIQKIISNGRFTQAQQRYENKTANPAEWKHDSATCWNLVCEEVIDTDHEPEGDDAVITELIRRGYNFEDINTMRRLAWRTAGWLNYDMMLWDWVNLDENDMRKALELQLEKRKIKQQEYEESLDLIQAFLDRDQPTKL